MMTRQSDKDRAEALTKLREWFPPGSTVYTVLRHVSRSGMQREIGVIKLTPDGDALHPNYSVAKALGDRQGKRDGIIVGGCGMDMGFHLIYNLSAALYRDGFECVGKGCPSNDHFNGDHNYEPHHHRDGGYALRQRWL